MKTGILIFYFQRALQDIFNNRFLHTVTIITVALSIIIVSAFGLFFVNASDVVNAWKKGIRIIAYLKDDVHPIQLPEIQNKIKKIQGVSETRFISKEDALTRLKTQMKRQAAVFENLKENPLPNVIEIIINQSSPNWEQVEMLASQIETVPGVAGVEYGQQWLGRITKIFNLFRFAGLAMCIVFFMAAVFIVANTIRLLFYSRREEFEIMRLVGATDTFIKTPFYFEGIIQGALGGLLGIVTLFIVFVIVTSNMDQGLGAHLIDIRFLSWDVSLLILCCSIFSGWLGCYLSLKKFLTPS